MYKVTCIIANDAGVIRANLGVSFPALVNWCFENLTKPAFLYTWEYKYGLKQTCSIRIWKKWTDRLRFSTKGTALADGTRAVTIQFRSQEDASLFACVWGSVNIAENYLLPSIEYLRMQKAIYESGDTP